MRDSKDALMPASIISALIWLPALLVALFDFFIRRATIVSFSYDMKMVYVASILFEALLGYLLLNFCVRLYLNKKNLSSWLALAGSALFYSVITVGSWQFFSYFRVLPGLFVISYIMTEPQDATNLMGDGLSLAVVGAVLVCLLVAALAWLPSLMRQQTRNKTAAIASALVAAGLFFILKNNQRIQPGSVLPFTDVVLSFHESILQWTKGYHLQTRLQPRPVSQTLPPMTDKAKFNAVLIVAESLRKQNLSAYGYERKTTPHLDALIAENQKRVVRFQHAFSNSTKTLNSIPSIMSGHNPIEGFDAIHRSNLIYEHINRFSNMRTALISSHSYDVGNYKSFLASSALDYFWYREVEGLPAYNNVGADDRYVPERFQKFLETVNADENFFAVLHFNGTHYPYKSPAATQIYGSGQLVDQYDGSIRYFDQNLGDVFAALKAKGVYDSTLIWITSDHGESFGEDGYMGHLGPFSPYTMNVPFLVFLPNSPDFAVKSKAALQKNAEAFVSNIDVLPTLLDLFGIEAASDQLKGVSLAHDLPEDRPILVFNFPEPGFKQFYFGMIWQRELWLVEEITRTKQLSFSVVTLGRKGTLKRDWTEVSPEKKQAFADILGQYPLLHPIREKILSEMNKNNPLQSE